MYSLLTVNNQISLINVNVGSSTFLVAITIILSFLGLYISGPSAALAIPRVAATTVARTISPVWNSVKALPAPESDKPLPEVPFRNGQLVLEDQQLVLAGRDIVLSRNRIQRHRRPLSYTPPRQQLPKFQEIKQEIKQDVLDIRDIRDTLPEHRQIEYSPQRQQFPKSPRHGDERTPPPSPRRLLTGLRTPRKSDAPSPLSSPQRSRHDGGRPRGLGNRFRRWVLASSVAETRQRRPEQRVLERAY